MENQNMGNGLKSIAYIYLVGFCVNVEAAETFICNVTETIEAKFEKGQWSKPSVTGGEGMYRVTITDEKAEIVEQSTEKDKISTECTLVGGTIGYECKSFIKIVPYGEKFDINYFHELNELHISSKIQMREMSDYSKDVMRTKKYFSGIRFSVKEQYAKCVKYQ